MKNVILIVFTMALSHQVVFSQKAFEKIKDKEDIIASTSEIVPIYFILGTLSDYMGRFQYIERHTQVDRYYPHEKPLVTYLTKFIQAELNIKVDTTFQTSNHLK
ncbi:MAG: hypothetical protein JEZ14_17100 [Marinilabiliaceae bacterium]|nr:hypothetical protein [Marinilabiliaceae bacterium]